MALCPKGEGIWGILFIKVLDKTMCSTYLCSVGWCCLTDAALPPWRVGKLGRAGRHARWRGTVAKPKTLISPNRLQRCEHVHLFTPLTLSLCAMQHPTAHPAHVDRARS